MSRNTILIIIGLIIAFVVVRPWLRNAWHNLQHPSIHVRRAGQGPQVVLLHGLSGNGAYWQPVMEALAAEYELIAPDLLGFGESPWPAEGYTMDGQLAFLEPVLPKEPFYLVGHSMGSLIAMEFARRHPERVKELVVLGPPSVSTRSELKEILKRQSRIESIMSLDSFWSHVACHIHEILGPLTYYLYRPFVSDKLPDEVVRSATEHRWESYNDHLENIVLQYQAVKTIAKLPRDKTVLMVGKNDGYSQNEKLRALDIDLREFPGGHNFLYESTDDVIATLRDVLRGH